MTLAFGSWWRATGLRDSLPLSLGRTAGSDSSGVDAVPQSCEALKGAKVAAELLTLAVKGVVGGGIVVAFALIGEVLRPRAVAGVTSGAPSVAVASLAVTCLSTGVVSAANQSRAMVAGAVALVVGCLCGLDTFKRFGALRGSMLATIVWGVAAFGLWSVALR